jgi:hypothetical protein
VTHEESKGRVTETEGGPEHDYTLPDALDVPEFENPSTAFDARVRRSWEKD